MNKVLKVIAGAMVMAAPLAAEAQSPLDPSVLVNITGQPFATTGIGYGTSGGGFSANFTVDFATGPKTFNDYLIWCIDASRLVGVPGGPYNFALYTLKDFALTNFGSANGHDPDLADMRRIASLQSQLETNWPTDRRLLQGSIWSWFDGYTTYGNDPLRPTIMQGDPTFNTQNYYVLWNGVNQTFLVQIPEPSQTLLLLVAGLGAVAVVVRRRNVA